MSSPWRFTAVLADIFAAQIVPPGTYNTLKLSLLLNLVQTCNNGKQSMEHLDLLIGTSDPVTVDRYSLVLCDIYDLYIKGGIYKISLRSLLNILDLSNYIIFLWYSQFRKSIASINPDPCFVPQGLVTLKMIMYQLWGTTINISPSDEI